MDKSFTCTKSKLPNRAKYNFDSPFCNCILASMTDKASQNKELSL